jgi:hypothetical protein
LQVVAKAKQAIPKLKPPRETDLRGYWESVQNAEPISSGLRPQPSTKSWAGAVGGAPGILEDDMQRRNSQRKPGTTRGSPRRRAVGRTARASRINRAAAKSRCAGEWGGWGRLSDDGPGHYNPDRSEGPWGKAADAACTVVQQRTEVPDSEPGTPRQRGARRADANRTSRTTRRRRAGPA